MDISTIISKNKKLVRELHECSPRWSTEEFLSKNGGCEYLEIRMYMWRKSWLLLIVSRRSLCEAFFSYNKAECPIYKAKCFFSEKSHSWKGLFPITRGHGQFLGLHKEFLFKNWLLIQQFDKIWLVALIGLKQIQPPIFLLKLEDHSGSTFPS